MGEEETHLWVTDHQARIFWFLFNLGIGKYLIVDNRIYEVLTNNLFPV